MGLSEDPRNPTPSLFFLRKTSSIDFPRTLHDHRCISLVATTELRLAPNPTVGRVLKIERNPVRLNFWILVHTHTDTSTLLTRHSSTQPLPSSSHLTFVWYNVNLLVDCHSGLGFVRNRLQAGPLHAIKIKLDRSILRGSRFLATAFFGYRN